jgi:hypothetical protein
MNYEQEVGQGRIKGVLWWGVGVVGLFVVGGDEIFVVLCDFVDKNQPTKFDLGVDGQGMMR